jgi:hypothetical protein
VKDGAVVVSSRAVPLPSVAAAWPLIKAMARTIECAGLKIRVRDEAGGIVILTGIASAKRLTLEH